MKIVSALVTLLVVVLGCVATYVAATWAVPVVAAEHGEEGHGDEGHGEEGHAHADGGHDEEVPHAEIDDARAAEHGIEFAEAGRMSLQSALSLPGEIALDASRVVHVVPRLTGVAVEVMKELGDTVAAGETLSVIDSRELADVKSDYLAALERRELAQSRYAREQDLFAKKITPAEDYLSAKQALAEEDIRVRSGEQKLLALGLTAEGIAAVRERRDRTLTDYTLVSPIEGTIIEKHLSKGEYVDAQADAFVIADTRQVWAEVVVYAADLRNIHEGQQVLVRSEDIAQEATGEVAYIGALIGEQTRTAKAIVKLPNPEGHWRPGLFVSVAMAQGKTEVPVGVPVDAVQSLNGGPVVFVRTGEAISARPVKTGRSDGKGLEIVEGLKAGERYVVKNSFLVKADIEKAGAAHDH